MTADQLTGALRRFAAAVAEHSDELTDLDTAVGDGDHGTNLDRGMRAVTESLEADRPGTPAAVFALAGRRLVSTVGGASGALYGTAFLRAGRAAGEAAALDASGVAAVLRAGTDGIAERGRCVPDDKTMYDAWLPATEAMEAAAAAGDPVAGGLAAAASAASDAVGRITPLVAKRGRASYLGERSAGHPDPGSVSSRMFFQALADEMSGG